MIGGEKRGGGGGGGWGAKKNGQVLNKPQIIMFLNWSIAAQDL